METCIVQQPVSFSTNGGQSKKLIGGWSQFFTMAFRNISSPNNIIRMKSRSFLMLSEGLRSSAQDFRMNEELRNDNEDISLLCTLNFLQYSKYVPL